MTGVNPSFDDELELADYIKILRRRWVWVALATALVVAAAVALSLTRVDSYQAESKVAIGSNAAQQAASNGRASVSARDVSNEVNLALSDQVRDAATERLGYEAPVGVAADSLSDSLVFSATATTPQDAADQANAWADVYVDTKRRQAIDSIGAAVEQFQADLEKLQAERVTTRQPLADLEARRNPAADATAQASLAIEIDQMSSQIEPSLILVDARIEAVARAITNLELNSRLAATGTATVVQVAAPPQTPVNGSVARMIVLATIVGLILGTAGAMLAENLDRTISSAEDLGYLGVPILGEIPNPGKELSATDLPFATMRHSGSQVAESYQKVRTALEFALLGRSINSLLITSANQSEGKTTLSTNLSWAMSAVDHKVALVDADFRRPRVHEVFGYDQVPGVSDNLLSGTPLVEAAIRVDEGNSRNLIVIPSGTSPPSPADFVANPAFTSLIRNLENEADLVVLDGPPVLPVSDAMSIGRQVDAVIVAAKVGSTKRDQLASTIENLTQVGADVIGVCLIGVKNSQRTYGYYRPDDAPAGRRKRSRAPAKAIQHANQIPMRPSRQAGPINGHRAPVVDHYPRPSNGAISPDQATIPPVNVAYNGSNGAGNGHQPPVVQPMNQQMNQQIVDVRDGVVSGYNYQGHSGTNPNHY